MALSSLSLTNFITLNWNLKQNEKVGASLSLGSAPSMCVVTLVVDVLLSRIDAPC
jgi:hypothetical protein